MGALSHSPRVAFGNGLVARIVEVARGMTGLPLLVCVAQRREDDATVVTLGFDGLTLQERTAMAEKLLRGVEREAGDAPVTPFLAAVKTARIALADYGAQPVREEAVH